MPGHRFRVPGECLPFSVPVPILSGGRNASIRPFIHASDLRPTGDEGTMTYKQAEVTDLLTPRLFWLLVERGKELEVRLRQTGDAWRFICPVDASHDVTLRLGEPGIAVTCHGPRGEDGVGHSLAFHRRAVSRECWDERWEWLENEPFPCRFCGCLWSQVIAGLGARSCDLLASPSDGSCSVRDCQDRARRVGAGLLCLAHLADRAGVPREVLIELAR